MMRKNALTMQGLIDRCWLVALRADLSEVRKVLPPEIEPVTFGGFAFLNVVVSHLEHMRPAPLPAWTGVGYWHVAYRVYVRYTPFGKNAGKRPVEGLYFLRSDANSSLMVAAGNLLTDFQFHRAAIDVREMPAGVELRVASEDAPLLLSLSEGMPTLSEGSPFIDLRAAAEFLRYQPAGISVGKGEVDVMRITRDENRWRYRLRPLVDWNLPLLTRFKPVPEVAYEVDPIEYRWNRAEHYARGIQ